ncbi:MAG: 50S ribosomal protein L9 [Clostridia bacterium]|nr:50S ribosomal protein L9 [Clostridia bacterium]
MQVILKKDLKGTGKAGDIVKVSDGYARNMLLPKGIAVEATKENLRVLERDNKLMAEKKAAEKAAAEAVKAELEKAPLVLKTKVGENGRLFGSITSMEIAAELKKQYDIEIDKKKIELKSPIKEIGDYELKVKLYPEVAGTVKLKVEEA